MQKMESIDIELVKDEIAADFGIEIISKRWTSVYENMTFFVEQMGLSYSVSVDRFLLSTVISDYFNDIKRLKDFHSINETNSIKETAYMSYWILRRKPLQITDKTVDNKDLVMINEKFVLQYICTYLSIRERKEHILLRSNKGLENFSGMLLYFLIYRVHDPYSLEMIIMAFFAGQIYEQIDTDISSEFHPYDVC